MICNAVKIGKSYVYRFRFVAKTNPIKKNSWIFRIIYLKKSVLSYPVEAFENFNSKASSIIRLLNSSRIMFFKGDFIIFLQQKVLEYVFCLKIYEKVQNS